MEENALGQAMVGRRRFPRVYFHILMPELRLEDLLESKRTNKWYFVSVLPTIRQGSARTPLKRDANPSETQCIHQERPARAVETSCKRQNSVGTR